MNTICNLEELSSLNQEPKIATKYVVEALFHKVYPILRRIKDKLDTSSNCNEDDVTRLKDLYTLTSSQIRKCFIHLFDVFKMEHNQHLILQESRQFTLERLSWCLKKLVNLENNLNRLLDIKQESSDGSNDSCLVTNMYFVNWIDNTFDILAKLTEIISKIDYKVKEDISEAIKIELVECLSNFHISLDELLLSAMTICRYCLESDQHIVKARCQVVLRETKALLSELIEGDPNDTFRVNSQSLKLPIMPSNINVLIDVLKDVLYALETNTNTALLSLLIHCFSYSASPVDILKEHFVDNKECLCANVDDTADDCPFVKEFDFYNERLLQIGSFAVSCSSDQNRIISLRSGLASLEALDPHLVPSLMISADSVHVAFLMDSWKKEVQEIRDSVFLIVDPGAFSDKSKQIIHQKVMELTKEGKYKNAEVCEVINIGNVVYDLFAVYNNYEPEALVQRETLLPLLTDLRKVIMECKIVSNILSSDGDFIYNVKKVKNKKDATFEQLLKRIKLLYSVINKINVLLHPNENEDQFVDSDEEQPKNVTHTVCGNIGNTYVTSPKKLNNLSKSVFARTTNIRSSTTNFRPSKLPKQDTNKNPEFSFTAKLDKLINDLSEVEHKDEELNTDDNLYVIKKYLEKVREPSILYKSPMKYRSSLRKAVLQKHKFTLGCEQKSLDADEIMAQEDKPGFVDDAMSLQITDVLNQLNDITNMSTTNDFNLTRSIIHQETNHQKAKSNNILRVNINKQNTPISKRMWKGNSTIDAVLDETVDISSGTQNSNVSTLERLNDLNLVESKLNDLKSCLFETSL